MSYVSLSFTLLFILITMFISVKKKLGLEKDIFVGTIRAAIQLILIGYVLHYVFSAEKIVFFVCIISIMITVAAQNAAKRGKEFKGAFWRIAVTLTFIECFVMTILIGLHIIEPTAQYIIPLSGMTVGSSMVVSSLFLNQLKREVETSSSEIEMLLALGASRKQALHNVMSRSVRHSMIPTIDSMKTVGLVQLPGMMTGMIIAGASPIDAVKYQILIMFTFTGAAALTSIVLSIFFHSCVLTEDLRLERERKQNQ